MKRTALLALLCACASSREAQRDTTREASAQADVRVVRTEEPERITTTIEEYAPEPSDWGMHATSGADQPSIEVSKTTPVRGSTGAPCHPILVRRTTTVEEKGKVVIDASGEAHREAHGEAKAEEHRESKPSGGCVGASYLWALAVLAVVLLGSYITRKAARAP